MSTFPPPVPPPADFGFQPVPGWIKPIGIISIVLGSLGLLCNCTGVVMMPMTGKMYEMIPQVQGQPIPPEVLPSPIHYLNAGLSVLVSALLLSAGILLLKRHNLARTLHIVYACIALPLAILGLLISLRMTAASNAWLQSAGVPANPGQNIGQYAGLGCGVVLGTAYPIFLLIWFLALGKQVPPRTDLPAA
jgi:hypothetical protein